MALADGDEGAQLAAMEIFEKLGAQPALEIVRNRLLAIPQHRIDKHRYGGLTTRERQVAALIAQGRSNREIGQSMVVGTRTVETYVTRILNKLGFDTRVQIATWALERGLVASSAPPDR
jgi:DNA-binding NarL/FixJ family response regulator